MRKECERSTCDRAATVGRLCRVHHGLAKARGEVGYTPSTPVLEHIRKLRALGWDLESIARASGLSATGVRSLVKRNLPRCRRYTANPILALPLEPYRSIVPCDATGMRRRVRALQTMGWRYEDICAQSGVQMSRLAATMSATRETSFATAWAIAEAYEVMCMKQGPSHQTAVWARNRGYAPPMAWDDETIDDPNAEPAKGEQGDFVDEVAVRRVLHGLSHGACVTEDLTTAERVAAATEMVKAGAGLNRTAKQLGLRWSVIRQIADEVAA